MEKTGKKWFRSTLVDGLLLMALGVAMLIWPEGSLKTLCVAAGAAVAVMGLVKVIVFLAGREGERDAGALFTGLVQLALGVALIVRPDFFITVSQYVTGVLLVYGAILMYCRAVSLRKKKGPTFVLSLLFAVLTTVLAAVIFLNPSAFAGIRTQIHGVSLIVEGAAMILVLRRIETKKESGTKE